MTPSKIKAPIERVAYTLPEAAAALGIGASSFEKYVKPDLSLIRLGGLVLVPKAELEQWAARLARPVLPMHDPKEKRWQLRQ